VTLDSPSRVVRIVALAAQARQMLPGEEVTYDWPLALGMPFRRRIAAVLEEAGLVVSMHSAPGAFTDEAVARDAERAGLRLVRRHGDVITLRRERGLPVQARERLVLRDALHVITLVLRAERALRAHASPDRFVAEARRIGAQATTEVTRAELRADIALLEPMVPGRRGCLRRIVAELMGSPEAAREPVMLGLTPHATGHASFAHTTPWAPEHPVSFMLADPLRRSTPPPSFHG
jgi:hypothetical protein